MRGTKKERVGDRRTARGAEPVACGLGVAGLMLLLAGCTGVDVERTLYPNRFAFDCSDGKTMQVARAPDGRSATVQVEGRPVTMTRVDSAAEEKYSGGGFVLYLDRDRAMLEQSGQVVFGPCRSQTVLPMAPRRND